MFIRNERSLKEFMANYPVVSGIIIIHIAIWLLSDALSIPLFERLYDLGVGHHYMIHQGEYWRFITPIFLHGGLMHMLFNSFSLVLFGPALERMIGKSMFLIAYLGAGVLANITTFFINPSFMFPHVGASGAIFGLFGIYIFMVVFRKSLIDSQNAQIVTVIFLIGLIMTFIRPGINQYAHILGFAAGFLIAPLVLVRAKPFYASQYRRTHHDDGEIRFNPNRWKRKRFSRKMKQNPLWIIIIVLAIIGLLSYLI
ncbi:rhomboid family intramembrane serine protease [Ornithinibacillus scapharcae]|uniref:rhomboid family intramembrane serine protease n=1 Tax=Ornithinibacillus scapharcae TaxID=1147159 RepID=UPI000225BE44|nr:rhomboid family intramembrane serine protease [Ornithinibacillus scapharcae]